MKFNLNNDSLTIIDIGALGGVSEKWKNITHSAVLFEPNPDAQFPGKENWLVIKKALAGEKGKKKLYITRKSSKSSFFPPNFELIHKFSNPTRFDVVKTIDVETDTLDNQLKINNVKDVDVIKLDVQGYELPILKAGTEALAKAVAVEVEVEFVQMYVGQPLFADVDKFMCENGFELVKFLNLENWKLGDREMLVWGDALYFKKLESLSAIKKIRLHIAKQALFSKEKVSFAKRKRILKRQTKQALKKVLAKIGLYHPAMGIKVGAIEKVATILQYKAPEIKVFVETGTNEGTTIDAVLPHFDKIYSVELDDTLYRKAYSRFGSNNKIKLFHGNSGEEIKKILGSVNEKGIFWLDAHMSGDITGKRPETTPVLQEIEAIFNHHVKGHVIIIDDARHFDRWTLRQMKWLAKTNNYSFEIKDGLCRLLPIAVSDSLG